VGQLFVIRTFAFVTIRLVFALWHFSVGTIGFVTNNAAKDAVNASTAFERALAETGFFEPVALRGLHRWRGRPVISKNRPDRTCDTEHLWCSSFSSSTP
jgi:hypothetical protein